MRIKTQRELHAERWKILSTDTWTEDNDYLWDSITAQETEIPVYHETHLVEPAAERPLAF